MRDGQVVCYESRKMNEHEQNYLTHDLELVVIIHALKMWRHYRLGRRFVLMSDHSGLRYPFDQSNLNARKYRWLATITEFNFEIIYIKGKENMVANSLSKWVQVNHIENMSSYRTKQERILQSSQQGVTYMELRHKFQHNTCTGTSSGTNIGAGTQGMDYCLTIYGLVRFQDKIYVT